MFPYRNCTSNGSSTTRSHCGIKNCIVVVLLVLLSFTFNTTSTTVVEASTTGSTTSTSNSNNIQQVHELQKELYDIINIAQVKIVEIGSLTSDTNNNNTNNTNTGNTNYQQQQSVVMKDKVVQLTTNITNIITNYKTILTLYTQQNKLIDEINIYQLQRLITKLHLLSTIYPMIHTNLTTPIVTNDSVTATITTNDSVLSATNTNKTKTNTNFITLNKLKDVLTPNSILNKIEDYLHTQLHQLISKEVTTSNNKTTIYDTVTSSWKNITKKLLKTKTTKKQSNTENNDCFINGYDAAKTLHEQLINYNNDYIGLNDIIQQYGATIVHEMTSVTYHGSGTTSTTTSTRDDDSMTTIGNSWYRKYIPYDWELYVLPTGWEYYNDPTISIINFYNHWLRAFGFATSASNTLSSAATSTTTTSTTTTTTTSTGSSLNAIPETIFNPNTIMPGSCWPMATNNGYITIRLSIPQNITITKITIDHVSKLNIIQPNNTLRSAPKYFNVYSYKSCPSTSTNINGNKNCNGLGFDITSKRLMNSKPFKYDINHIPGKISSVQTFPLRAVYAANDITSTHGDDNPSTCSPSKPACTSADLGETSTGNINSNDDIAAIGIEILENWGKEEYTCIYRIRLHTE